MNTSAGYHTFSFSQKTSEEEYFSLTNDFQTYKNQNDDLKGFPIKDENGKCIGFEYFYCKNKGIRWKLLSITNHNGFTWQGVTVVINPKAIIDRTYNYIVASKQADLEKMKKFFDKEAGKISPILKAFGNCSLNRVDFCMNIDLNELRINCSPEKLMYLIKQGKIPSHFSERSQYDKNQHRNITDKNSFYLVSNSVTANYYWKFPQMNEKSHPYYRFRESSMNVIRFEVQCKYSKLHSLAKKHNLKSAFAAPNNLASLEKIYQNLIEGNYDPTIPIDAMLSDELANYIVEKYFYKIVRKGDYFAFDKAKEIIKSYQFRRDKENRLIKAITAVKTHHGIANTISCLSGSELNDFKRSLHDLDKILVNPVTIPRRWNIEHIPNLLCAYKETLYEEEIIPQQEYIARSRLQDFLRGGTL